MAYKMPVPPPRPDVYNGDGTFNADKAEMIYAEITRAKWPEEQKIAMLQWLKSAAKRAEIKTRYANAAELAASVDLDFNVTPALAMISDAIEGALNNPNHNLIITMPPQEGKSSIAAVWTPIRALQLDPNRRIILATYGDTLAEEHSGKVRTIINSHGTDVIDSITGLNVEDKIGLKLATKGNRVSSWGIEGGNGGLKACGIGSAITGRPADLFIIDDPYKNMMEADSPAHRRKINEWMDSVARTRRSPHASMILIQTRWHPEDLAGVIIEGERKLPAERRTWKLINIPAIAEANDGEVIITDALNRPPGEAMQSARGRTKQQFLDTREQVGERVWYAMYQGSPRNPAGGLFERAWFEPRLEFPPARPIAAVIGVDPADSGKGDETGLIGGVLDQDGTVVLTEDWSGKMTSDQWGRQAVIMALSMGAREIAMEAYTTAVTYAGVIRKAWRAIHTEALEKAATGAVLSFVEQRACSADMPFTIFKWRAPSDAIGRSALLRQALETKKCRLVEYKLGVFESQAADWQAGQHCPDRVSAAVITHDRLAALGNGQMSMASPITARPHDAPAWMKRRITDNSTARNPFLSRRVSR